MNGKQAHKRTRIRAQEERDQIDFGERGLMISQDEIFRDRCSASEVRERKAFGVR